MDALWVGSVRHHVSYKKFNEFLLNFVVEFCIEIYQANLIYVQIWNEAQIKSLLSEISGSHGGEYEDGCLLGGWAV
jgi:hypothetical protein